MTLPPAATYETSISRKPLAVAAVLMVGQPLTKCAEPLVTPSSLTKPYDVYEVVQSVAVNGGITAPWFGQGGGGIQYEFTKPISELIKSGVLKVVTP